jgi:hypothetical protein
VNDADCPPRCGDGVLDVGETCDPAIAPGSIGACPTSCDDGDLCTHDALAGEGTCWPECDATPIVTCDDADGCCPSGCAFAFDSDCPPPSEICNGVDDDGDFAVDEGCDDDADGYCDAVMTVAGSPPVCAFGVGDCDDALAAVSPGSTEICDGKDQDCDGLTDEGNPGGGAACDAAAVGGCASVMTCAAGTLACRGGFVAPFGSAGGPGTRTAPVASISEAIAYAVAAGAGADVCACAPDGAGDAIYEEPITMVEGVSVIGNYDCATWERFSSGRRTRIRNTRTDGIRFPAGITQSTSLDGFEIEPLVTEGGTSMALRVTDSSPSLVDVDVDWPASSTVPRSGIGLQIVATTGTAAPTVSGGDFSGPAFASQASIGIDCQACAGATLAADTVRFGNAPQSVGIHVRGAADGLTILGGNAFGYDIEGPWAYVDAVGVWLDGCTGSPEIGAGTGLRIRGGTDPRSAFGVRATGAACAPVLDGDGASGTASVLGCSFEFGAGTCVGVSCEKGSACEIRDQAVTGALFIVGMTQDTAETIAGVRCLDGSCGLIERLDVSAGDPTAMESSVGIDLVASAPLVEGNSVRGSDGVECPSDSCAAVRMDASAARLANNVLRQGRADGVVLDVLGQGVPDVHSNAILPTCFPGGSGVGIRIQDGASPGPRPAIRNNIIAPQPGSCAGLYGVQETGAQADPSVFANNDLFGMSAALYINEGIGALTTLPQVNALPESSANLDCDPALDGTAHIGTGSCCVDAGESTNAPETDRDGQPRPMGLGFDVGPDEVAP